MITNYYYNNQIRKYIVQFASIFSGMQVSTGIGKNGSPAKLNPCPVRYGSIDRVVGSITNRNTQNTPFVLPMMSIHMNDLELAPERRKGVGFVDSRAAVLDHGIYPTDMKQIKRSMPIPYNMNMELSLYAANTDESFQIMEQIMMIFDPTLQIQKSDDPYDWGALTYVELQSMSSEENYPMGAEKRVIVWTFNFTMPVNITPPMDIKNSVINQIILRFGDLDKFSLDEYDANGELQPFSIDGNFGTTVVNPA